MLKLSNSAVTDPVLSLVAMTVLLEYYPLHFQVG